MILIDDLILWYIKFPINHFKLFIYHCLFNFILSLFIYYQIYPFYDPKKESIHAKYYVFRRLDKLNYYRLLIGLIVFFWPRLILFCISMTVIAICVNCGKNIHEPKDKQWKDQVYSYGARFILFTLGNVIPVFSLGDNKIITEVYKKYLGPDYVIDYNKKFCLYI